MNSNPSTQSKPMLNLIPSEVRSKRLVHRSIRRWVSIIVCVAFFVGSPGVYIGGSAALTDSGMIYQIEQARQKYEADQVSIPVLRAKLSALEAEEDTNEIVKNRVNWSGLFDLLRNAAGEEIRFTRLSVIGGGVSGDHDIEIQIVGFSTSQTNARSYLLDLEQMEIFDFVELTDTRREIIQDHELIRFELLLKVTGSDQVKETTGGGG